MINFVSEGNEQTNQPTEALENHPVVTWTHLQ